MREKLKGIILVMIIFFGIIFYGFISISGTLPKFIKDRSNVKINYSLRPFDFTVDFGQYSFYINKKVITNIKTGSSNIVKSIGDSIGNAASSAARKTSNVFKDIEDKIK